jgi:hypothetical protein
MRDTLVGTLGAPADAAPAKPLGKGSGFMLGAGLAALGGFLGSWIVGGDETLVKNIPIVLLASVGGGIAGALVAPSSGAPAAGVTPQNLSPQTADRGVPLLRP